MSSIKSQAVSGARWTIGARLVRAVVGIGTMAVLARFLTSADYGIMALILFVTMFAQVLGDFGLRVALVQRKTITRIEETSVFWANILFGAILTGIAYFCAGPISALFGAPGLETPLRHVSPILFLNTLQGVSMSMLERRFDFRAIALSEIAGALVGAATAIAMVLAGYGIEAIVAQQLVYTSIGVALVLLQAGWRPGLGFSWGVLRPLLGYGSYVALGSGTQFLSNQIDRPILARGLSAASLGYFAIANQIVLSPVLIIVQAVSRVLFPMLSSIQDDKARSRNAYLRILHALVLIMAPISFGLIALAAPFVAVVLGPGWDPVVPLIGILAVSALTSAFARVNGALLAAQGQARFQARWSIVSMVVFTGTLILATPFGLAIALAARVGAGLVMAPVYAHVAMRQIGQSWGGMLRVVVRPILAGAIMCGVIRLGVAAVDWPPVAELLAGIVLGLVTYVAGLMVIDRERSRALLRDGLLKGRPPV